MFATICLVSAGAAIAVDMPPLARKDTCTDCHAIDRKIVGPAWMDISRRYKDVPEFEYKGKIYSLEDGLVMKISRGGSGNWGAMPMPKNDPGGAKEADYRELVRFILSLAK
jgi:cytochrome c551/c552